MICPCCGKPKKVDGLGTALKPAMELIALARKPLIGTIAQNVLAHSTGALNIDGCRVGHDEPTKTTVRTAPRYNGTFNGGEIGGAQSSIAGPDELGRWPANVLHDSSLEVLECFAAEDRPAIRFFYSPKASAEEREEGLEKCELRPASHAYGDGLNSATKVRTADQAENGVSRNMRRNHHPTVKPVDLMAWLVRLITPPKGIVLDPFMGSGTTGIAALRQGFRFVGIEQSEEYFEIACARIRAAYDKPDLFTSRPKEKPVQGALSFEGVA